MLAVLLIELVEVEIREQGNVANSLPQWRLHHRDHVDAVIEVFAELAGFDHFFQVAVGGENQSHVDFVRFVATDRFKLFVLQHSQEFDLQAGWGGCDFVEEQSAAVGREEFPFFILRGSRERTLHVTEQLAFEQVLRQRSTGDFHEGLIAAVGLLVNRSGGHGFAGAALAENQHGGFRVGHTFDEVEHLEHFIIVPDDVLHAEPLIELGFERFVFFDDATLTDRPLDGELEFFVDHGFCEVIEGPEPNRFDGTFDGSVTGQQNHCGLWLFFDGPFEKVKAIGVGQVDIANDGFETEVPHAVDGVFAGGCGFGAMTETPQIISHCFDDMTVVIDDQQRTLGVFHGESLKGCRLAVGNPTGQGKSGGVNLGAYDIRARRLNRRCVVHVVYRAGCFSRGCTNLGHRLRLVNNFLFARVGFRQQVAETHSIRVELEPHPDSCIVR